MEWYRFYLKMYQEQFRTYGMIVLSHYQAAAMLRAKQTGVNSLAVSLDLNLTMSDVGFSPEGVVMPKGTVLGWSQVEEIASQKTACFSIHPGNNSDGMERIHKFSETFKRAYSLMPTEKAPTMLMAGFPMHRIKGIDPQEDTWRKIRTISPVSGRILDTTTGLGYTAIAAARTATEVITIELDPTALEICRRNPWSQELFTNSKIQQKIGNSCEVIETLETESFTRIFHDPPTFKLAGDLYSESFYRQLYRVLRRGGKLYHYVGDFESKSVSSIAKGIAHRLQEVGFQNVKRAPDAFGFTAAR